MALDYYNKEPISFKPSESFIVQKSLRKNKPIVFNKSLFRTFRYIPEYIWPKFEWIFSLQHLVKNELKHLKNYAKNRSRDMNLSLQDIKTVQKRVKLISKKAKKCTFLYPLCIGGVKSHYYYQDVKNVLHKHVLNLSPMWFESKDKKNGTRQIELDSIQFVGRAQLPFRNDLRDKRLIGGKVDRRSESDRCGERQQDLDSEARSVAYVVEREYQGRLHNERT